MRPHGNIQTARNNRLVSSSPVVNEEIVKNWKQQPGMLGCAS